MLDYFTQKPSFFCIQKFKRVKKYIKNNYLLVALFYVIKLNFIGQSQKQNLRNMYILVNTLILMIQPNESLAKHTINYPFLAYFLFYIGISQRKYGTQQEIIRIMLFINLILIAYYNKFSYSN